MLVIRPGIHKMLVRKANMEDSDQTASSVMGCLSRPFWQATSIQNFRPFTIILLSRSIADGQYHVHTG